MKQLNLDQLEKLNGGETCFNSTPECIIGLASVGVSVFSLFTGVGTLAGMSMLFSLAGAMPACFECPQA